MNSEKQFYVYVHRRKTDGRVFYVGKGKGNRAWSNQRNRYWHNIVGKHGVVVKVIARFSNEECAFSMERALIKFYGRKNLCNMTDGGDGMSGYIHSVNSKMIISKNNSVRVVTDETRLKHSLNSRGRQKTDRERNLISKRMLGNKLTLGLKHSEETKAMMSKDRTGKLHPNFDSKIRYFSSEIIDAKFIGTQYDFCKMFSLDRTSISAICTGKRKRHKGWVVLK